tara:strand:- start:318 stop:1286 length:969 start_codon:yes stop_codon:yes gene_type:complete
MKIYPQCRNGIFPPLINALGQVMPCCMQQYESKVKTIDGRIVDNIFSAPEFNINNRRFGDIIESPEWLQVIETIEIQQHFICGVFCKKKKPTPFNRGVTEYKQIETKEFDTLQVEMTNVCTLKCPYCRRQTAPIRLNKDQLDINRLWDAVKYKHWEKLIDCSIYGDPLWYDAWPTFLERMVQERPVSQYNVSLAATGRGLDYWRLLVKLFGKLHDRGVVVDLYFGIDGVRSYKHRVNQDWDEITGALQMIASETNIVPKLQFIPFSWNEHEIDHMMLLAEKWGAEFYLRKSSRFRAGDPNTPTDPDLYHDYISDQPKKLYEV